jgi:hypothetical protein
MAWGPFRGRRRGIMTFTSDAMKSMLNLPAECNLLHVVSDYNKNGIVTVVVESPYLDEVIEGSILPEVTISQITGYDE